MAHETLGDISQRLQYGKTVIGKISKDTPLQYMTEEIAAGGGDGPAQWHKGEF